ncbi:MAG: HPr family phosphocarrier protein [Treponema sp.]|nr:HPr family phosphocarrier protein [Treponema sp.]
MTEQTITIVNRAGIHARPAAMVVQLTKNYSCNIYFEKGKDRINAKSIMGIITLGASYGTELKIIADGNDEEIAVKTLVRLFESKFEEE